VFDPNSNSNNRSSSVTAAAISTSSSNETAEKLIDDESTQVTIMAGKGHGGWLYVSHELIQPSELQLSILDSIMHVCYFKFEPMLLHVAACNLERGKQFLRIVLGLGFRESGLIVTADARVTVAVRSYSLALTVPCGGASFPLSQDYWSGLVDEANRRLQLNLQRVQKLKLTIEQILFRPANIYPTATVFNRLPPLNLWGVAAVTIPLSNNHGSCSSSNANTHDVLVFGGYGSGPTVDEGQKSDSKAHPSRSDKVYRMRFDGDTLEASWKIFEPTVEAPDVVYCDNFQTLRLKSAILPAREGAAACVIATKVKSTTSLVVVFGGRQSPACPLDDIFLCACDALSLYVRKPLDVRGESPGPRWGHSLTALKENGNKLCVLVGGRNTQTALGSIHVLSHVEGISGDSHLLWETLEICNDIPLLARFHHDAVAVGDCIFVFGGLLQSNLLASFGTHDGAPPFTFNVSFTKPNVHILGGNKTLPYFGHSMCLLSQSQTFATNEVAKAAFLSSGGVHCCSDEASDAGKMQLIEVSSLHDETGWSYSVTPVKAFSNFPDSFEGPLVHHSCLLLNGSTSFRCVLLGGGVSGFGFQPLFAESYSFDVRLLREAPPSIQGLSIRVETTNYSQQTVTRVPGPASERNADVVYVQKKHAKDLKSMLQSHSLLDLAHRMGPADKNADLANVDLYIAVPINRECVSQLTSNENSAGWMRFVAGAGKQELPFRSSTFAKKAR
jgi:tRNA(Phe) wybutosine-synthesizing methylase Tyw3